MNIKFFVEIKQINIIIIKTKYDVIPPFIYVSFEIRVIKEYRIKYLYRYD